MKRFYISTLLVLALFCSQKITAQIACNASFYIDSVASTPFNAVIVNNSTFTPALVPPDSGIYVWLWGDGTSSVGKYPTHTYTKAGTVMIYLLIENQGKTCSDSAVKWVVIDTTGGFHKTNAAYTVRVVPAGAAQGITTVESDKFVSIAPNIVKDHVNLNFKGMDKHSVIQAEVFSYDGKKVASVNEELQGNSLRIETLTYPAGMYFVTVKAGEQTTLLKFIKQ